jgi:hypothetical protein
MGGRSDRAGQGVETDEAGGDTQRLRAEPPRPGSEDLKGEPQEADRHRRLAPGLNCQGCGPIIKIDMRNG